MEKKKLSWKLIIIIIIIIHSIHIIYKHRIYFYNQSRQIVSSLLLYDEYTGKSLMFGILKLVKYPDAFQEVCPSFGGFESEMFWETSTWQFKTTTSSDVTNDISSKLTS